MSKKHQSGTPSGDIMLDTIKTILAAKRRHFLKRKPVFHFFAPAAEMDLFVIARQLNCKLCIDLSRWLRIAGYGDINDMLIFRNDYFSAIGEGALSGCVTFARDELGNAYAFSRKDEGIYYVDRNGDSYARMADDFLSFLQELIRRNYDLAQWRDTLLPKRI